MRGSEHTGWFRSMTVGNNAFPAASGRWVPKPKVPVYPVLSSLCPGPPRVGDIGSTLDRPMSLWTENGRTALYWAIRGSIGSDRNEVLCPAYHCLSMVDAIRAAGGQPVFFRCSPDLSANVAELERHLTARTAAVVLVHFFGVMEVDLEMRPWADSIGIVLVEDCAHALFGGDDETPVGRIGHYAISSVRKFLPVAPGGLLTVNTGDDALEGVAVAGARGDALRAVVGAIGDSTRHGRLGSVRRVAEAAKWAVDLARKRRQPATSSVVPPSSPIALWACKRPSRSSHIYNRFITKAVNRPFLAERRREIYERVIEVAGSCKNVVPLKNKLSANAVPYMVPLRVSNLCQVFEDLEDAGMPMLRFGQFLDGGRDSAKGDVARAWSQDGLQLPCHQSLCDSEVEAMLELFVTVVGRREHSY